MKRINIHKINSQQGSVAVFLSIIFVSLFIVAAVLTDIAGMRTAEIHAQRAVDIASRSVLSEYDRNLKTEYGLFAVCESEVGIEEKIAAYTNRMLNPDLNISLTENTAELYDFRVEKISVDTDAKSLNNIMIFENQITEFMKYRAPLGHLYDFSEQIENVSKASNSLELVNKATAVFKKLANLEEYLNHLRKYSDGWFFIEGKKFTIHTPFIKSIGVKNPRQYENSIHPLLKTSEKEKLMSLLYSQDQLRNLSDDYLTQLDTYVGYRCRIKCLKALEKRIRIAKISMTDEEKKLYYEIRLRSISGEIKKCEKAMKGIERHSYYEFYEDRKKSCNKALSTIQQIKISIEDANELVNEVDTFIKQFGSGVLDSVKVSIESDMEIIRKLVGAHAENLFYGAEQIIESNGKAIEKQLEHFVKEIEIQKLEDKSEKLGTKLDIESDITIENVRSQIESLLDKDMSYKGAKESYKKAFNTFLLEYDSSYDIEPFSVSQIQYMMGETRNQEIFTPNFSKSGAQQDDLKGNVALKNSYIITKLPSHLHETVENNPNKKDTLVNILSQLKGDGLKGEQLKNNLYVNEYILTFFRNHITSSQDKTHFFDHEVEYILYGELKDQDNYTKFKSHLSLVRSGMNLLHIYSDPHKRAQVMEIAVALSGGTGTFLLQFIIASAWAGAEADEDISKLVKGEKVAFIKSKESWVLSFENFMSHKGDNPSPEMTKKSDTNIQPNMFSYEDYLRIFLLMKNKEKKLYRTLDLIQINMKGRHYRDFETKYYTGVLNVKAEFSIKYRFLTLSWMPESIKQPGSIRKNIKVEVQHGF